MLYKTKRIVKLERRKQQNAARHSIAPSTPPNVQGSRTRVYRPPEGFSRTIPASGGASQVSISQQNPVRVFVSHASSRRTTITACSSTWSSHNFFYRNCSDPAQRGTGERDKLKDELRRQIALAEVVIVPSGQYGAHPEWIDFQLNCAKGLDKPVIVLEAFGVKEKMPVQLEALATRSSSGTSGRSRTRSAARRVTRIRRAGTPSTSNWIDQSSPTARSFGRAALWLRAMMPSMLTMRIATPPASVSDILRTVACTAFSRAAAARSTCNSTGS